VVDGKVWLFHGPTQVVGAPEKYFDGVGEIYVSPVNGEPVTGPVLAFASGHVLVADPEAFLELERPDVVFYAVAVERVHALTVALARAAHDSGMALEKMVPLYAAALRAQVAAMEQGTRELAS
jgi:hypothetical protein